MICLHEIRFNVIIVCAKSRLPKFPATSEYYLIEALKSNKWWTSISLILNGRDFKGCSESYESYI